MKTHGPGPAVPHFLTQKSFTEGPWLGLAVLWSLVNLLEDPNDDADAMHMDVDASRCLWALYHGRRASTCQPLFQQQESPDEAADADTSESEI